MTTRSFGELDVTTPLVGRHQAINAALAVEVLEHAPEDLRPGRAAVLDGIRSVRHRGRDEIRVIDGRTWLFDVAHNTAGVESLVDTMDRVDLARPRRDPDRGARATRSGRKCFRRSCAARDGAVLTVPPSAPIERLWDPAAAADAVHAGPATAVVPDFTEAVAEASRRAREGTVVVTGSVHTVGGAMRVLGVDPLG